MKPKIESQEPLNWGAVSADYLEHRPGYPPSYFELLRNLGIGLPGQDILDLGTGTGALSIPFAENGARVCVVDPSEGQINAAMKAARSRNVDILFKVASAEETGFPDRSFDVISASMCWGYFNHERMKEEVPRLLRPSGLLLISSLIWAGSEDFIGGQTDELIRRYNPAAEQLGRGEDELIPSWSKRRFRLKTHHEYQANLPFNRESWRGRIRASKWIGAALEPERAQAFDLEHQELLERIAPPQFEIRHRIRIQIFQAKQYS